MHTGKVTIQEQWIKPAGESMLGMGRTIRDGKTVFTEFYRKDAQGLFARVEGVDKGKKKYHDFAYRRVSCE